LPEPIVGDGAGRVYVWPFTANCNVHWYRSSQREPIGVDRSRMWRAESGDVDVRKGRVGISPMGIVLAMQSLA